MAKIVNVYREKQPAFKLVGKSYSNEDRDGMGGFSSKWGDWFTCGWFDLVEACGKAHSESGYVGAMRMNEGKFEYVIGVLMESVNAVPEGFSCIDIPESDYAVAWIKGKDDKELYSMHEQCMSAFAEKGYKVSENAWYIEEYTCPRFTCPDDNGEVVLDYAVTVKGDAE